MSANRDDRLEPEPPDRDQRSPFERDRDRILYTSAFRRLAEVTQVASADHGHVVHNRLTHTLKVAQIARRLAEHLCRLHAGAGIADALSPDVVEAAALAHDLGHPPFGHIAEHELHRLVRQHGEVSDGYEGNAQSFRIVTLLAVRREEPSGLNLTRATLGAILKYPWHQAAEGKKSKKWGAYASECGPFRFARTGHTGDDPTLEAQIMDWADDIAYSVHDLEDFYRAGLIPLHRLRGDAGEVRRFLDEVEHRREGEERPLPVARAALEQALSSLLELAPPALAEAYRGSSPQRGATRRFSAVLIRRCVLASAKPERAEGRWQLAIDPGARAEVLVLKELTAHFVFNHPALAAQQHGQRRAVREVFVALWESLQADGPGILPIAHREAWDTSLQQARDGEERKAGKARVCADTIASMTERQLLAFHRRVSGFEAGSVLDAIVR